MSTIGEKAFRQAIFGGIFLVLVAFWATEGLVPFVWLITGMPLEFYPPDGRIRAISVLSLILSRTILLWLYTRWASQRNIFHIKFNPNKIAIALVAVTIAVTIAATLAVLVFSVGGGIAYSWIRFGEFYGPTLGPINTILQYLYYAWEGMAMAWIVDTFQTAGEIRGKKTRVLWGTIALCLFWALPHLATKGLILTVLLWSLSFAVIFGVLYIKSGKNFWPPFLFWMAYCLAFCY